MKNASSFQCLRSVNNRLHNKMSQETQYGAYLKRIDNIVDRKPHRDTSSDFYMNFLHKCKGIARKHQESLSTSKILNENQHLLNKIIQNKNSNHMIRSQTYHLNLYEKRNREIEKITEQNFKMVKRITDQPSVLRKTMNSNQFIQSNKDRSMQKKSVYAGWNYSPLRQEKLPKLISSCCQPDLSKSSRISTKRLE